MNPREVMARRAASELEPGSVVNLGIGIPTLILDVMPPDSGVIFHTENGLLGMGSASEMFEVDDEIVNAAKQPIGERVGAAYFDSAASFAMIRGGHVDVAVLGALQVDETGRIANWVVPGEPVLGVGGAMDLLVGAPRVVVLMTHLDRAGRSKLVKQCTLPLTGLRSVDVIITDYAVFHVRSKQLHLVELMSGHSLADVEKSTAASFVVALSEKERDTY